MSDAEQALIPARMLNEVVYCPRLFALEHMNGEWAESADTVRGSTVHRRVDQPSAKGLPEPGDEHAPPQVVRSVHLGDRDLGIVARIDVVEGEGSRAVPVDFKKGRVPREGAWPPEQVQVGAQALLLRAHGYQCDQGMLYFAGSRRRVEVPLTDELVADVREAVRRAREILRDGVLPPPLVDSPKCWGCSLVGLCLPDEQNMLNERTTLVRPLAPSREEGLPLYVEQRGAKLSRRGGEIFVKADGEIVERVRVADTSRIVVRGAVSLTSPLLQTLSERGIPLALHAWSGRLVGMYVPVGGHNVLGRMAQHRAAGEAGRSLQAARAFVYGKVSNQRVLLRRNGKGVPDRSLELLKGWAEQALSAASFETLLGIEGTAARTYFAHFPTMLKDPALAAGFDFGGRNRRPPKDPLNALLSLAYAFLLREVTNVLAGIGLDPWVGLMHRPRPGRPSLSLDLMEEFRPVLADSVVLTLVNNGTLTLSDFDVRRVGVALRDAGRKKFIRAFERRLSEEATHPQFSTRMSYRRIVEVQARLLCKFLLGEIPEYPPLKVR